jgi:PilZ domain
MLPLHIERNWDENLSDVELAERRRGLRVSQRRPVKVFDACAGRYFGGQTHDLSERGLRIELPKSTPVNPGAILELFLGADANAPLAIRSRMRQVRIVWINRESPDSQSLLVAGVEFVRRAAAAMDAA